jgi:hypothetical protein
MYIKWFGNKFSFIFNSPPELTYIKTYKKQEAKLQFNQDRNININNNNQFPPLNPNETPVPIPANQQTSYSQILSQNLQSPNTSEQL